MRLPWREALLDGHLIRTAISDREAAKLGELAAGKRVLEVGSAYGFSAIVMAQSGAESVLCVDPHAGELPDSLRILEENVRRHGVAERVTVEIARSQDALPRLRRSGVDFDLVFLDGDHSRSVAEHDVYWATALLREHGVLAVHDYDNEVCPDVKPAVEWAFSGREPSDMSVTDTLWVASPGARARRRRKRRAPRISMCLIAGDEQENVERCFDSFWDHVDEVCLALGNDCTDDTEGVARRFAAERGEPEKLVIGRFPWTDDFAAARNFADSLASCEWLTFVDLDEVIIGAERLRDATAECPEGVNLSFRYEYAVDTRGNPTSVRSRGRLIRRADASPWIDPVHERRLAPLSWSTAAVWRHLGTCAARSAPPEPTNL